MPFGLLADASRAAWLAACVLQHMYSMAPQVERMQMMWPLSDVQGSPVAGRPPSKRVETALLPGKQGAHSTVAQTQASQQHAHADASFDIQGLLQGDF